MNKKLLFSIFVLFIICLILIIYSYLELFKKEEDKSIKIQSGIKYFNINVLNNIEKFEKCFENRYTIIRNNEIIIGKNKKELENGYYDICIKIKNEKIYVYINKLFKEFKINNICEVNYLEELINYIVKIFNLELPCKEKLLNLINNNYMKIREEKKTNYINIVKEIDNVNIKIVVENNMILLIMGDIDV